jgi:16S rRNA (cytidine1402-2'-O)-methyltransferase
MPLTLIATPIGNPRDISERAIASLKTAEIVIGEERREVSKLLKSLGIEGKTLELLNEHSTDEDVKQLRDLCRDKQVALVTDCGTPGFCDPGARLVAACRADGLITSPVPGASSLMCLLSVSGRDMREFLFRGFLPAERESRAAALRELERERRPVVIMDTPYRLTKLLGELAARFPERRALLGCDFTQATESIHEGKLKDLASAIGERKAEFILALFPSDSSTSHATAATDRSRREHKDTHQRGSTRGQAQNRASLRRPRRRP